MTVERYIKNAPDSATRIRTPSPAGLQQAQMVRAGFQAPWPDGLLWLRGDHLGRISNGLVRIR